MAEPSRAPRSSRDIGYVYDAVYLPPAQMSASFYAYSQLLGDDVSAMENTNEITFHGIFTAPVDTTTPRRSARVAGR